MSSRYRLAIETSQREGSVAVRTEHGSVTEEALRESKRHDDDLMPAIERLTNRLGLTPSGLDCVAVSLGPGGFTGLRIAVATAKMLALTTGCKLIGIPSALVAANALVEKSPCVVALAAKRSTAWLTTVIPDDRGWRIDGTPILGGADVLDLHGVNALVADNFLPDEMRLKAKHAGITIVPPEIRATFCLEAAQRWEEDHGPVSPHDLLPIYSRPPEAVALWQKRKGQEESRHG